MRFIFVLRINEINSNTYLYIFLKGMTQMIVDSATIVVNLLGAQIEREGGVADINVEYHTNKFVREVIARLCFGSNYFVGEEIFSKLRVLAHITSKIGIINALFPIMRFEILLPNIYIFTFAIYMIL